VGRDCFGSEPAGDRNTGHVAGDIAGDRTRALLRVDRPKSWSHHCSNMLSRLQDPDIESIGTQDDTGHIVAVVTRVEVPLKGPCDGTEATISRPFGDRPVYRPVH